MNFIDLNQRSFPPNDESWRRHKRKMSPDKPGRYIYKPTNFQGRFHLGATQTIGPCNQRTTRVGNSNSRMPAPVGAFHLNHSHIIFESLHSLVFACTRYKNPIPNKKLI